MNIKIIGACLALAALPALGASMVKSGETIAFMGDSITEFGDWPAGYINMVVKGFEVAHIQVGKIPVGHSAETSKNMASRFDRDVVAAKPQWVTISCGVNDVARMLDKNTGKVDYAAYKTHVRSMLDKAQTAGIRPVLLTPTLRYEEKPDSDENRQILELCAFLREEAKARNIPIADLNARMRATLAKMPPAKGPRLTRDGVHMNYDGNAMMATGVLEAFGVTVTPEMEAAWRDLPDGHCFNQPLSWAEAQKIEKAKAPGEDRKHCAERLVRETLKAGKPPLVAAPPAAKRADPKAAPEIVFLGDRVMAFGKDHEAGWVNFIVQGLEASEGRPVPSHMFAWWLKDLTAELMTNSVSLAAGHPKRAVLMLGSREMRLKNQKDADAKLALVKERMTRLVDTFVAAKTEVVVCGQPVMANDLDSADNRNVVAYNAWLKGECERRGAKFVDLYALMVPELKARAGQVEAEPYGDSWFVSGWYHMILNYRGHALAAENVLKAFGVPVTPAMREAWRNASGACQPQLGFSLNEWDDFTRRAQPLKMDAAQYATGLLKQALK